MAHPLFGTTKKIDPLLLKVQNYLDSKGLKKSTAKENFIKSLELLDEPDRLQQLKNYVEVQNNFLWLCQCNGINITKGLIKFLEENTNEPIDDEKL
jgi:hypothetical protein